MTAVEEPRAAEPLAEAIARARAFPRLRYMGSKYRLVPQLAAIFAETGGTRALDAFSGSGVVSYLMKAQGYEVTSNDFLDFPGVITRAAVGNGAERLAPMDIETICGPNRDGRDFIRSTFAGLYFDQDDRSFLDSAWSHIDTMTGGKRDLAIAALLLSAARKQPRGVFTFTDSTRYVDGRRDLRLSLREHFVERAQEYNDVVFDDGRAHRTITGDVAALPAEHWDLVYLDPPYAPPSDDADYMKRYHFLQGLSVYWEGQELMPETRTKKIAKKYTPFAYKRTITEALRRTLEQFADSGTIVLSYSTNALPGADVIEELMRRVKAQVTVHRVNHTYSFGTHATAHRRAVSELVFVGR